MLQQLLDGFDQLRVVVFCTDYLAFQVVNSVNLLGHLVQILPSINSANRTDREVDRRMNGEQPQMLLMVLLEGKGDSGGGQVEGSQLLEILDHLVELAVGGRFDDVLLNFLILLRHIANYDMTVQLN